MGMLDAEPVEVESAQASSGPPPGWCPAEWLPLSTRQRLLQGGDSPRSLGWLALPRAIPQPLTCSAAGGRPEPTAVFVERRRRVDRALTSILRGLRRPIELFEDAPSPARPILDNRSNLVRRRAPFRIGRGNEDPAPIRAHAAPGSHARLSLSSLDRRWAQRRKGRPTTPN